MFSHGLCCATQLLSHANQWFSNGVTLPLDVFTLVSFEKKLERDESANVKTFYYLYGIRFPASGDQ